MAWPHANAIPVGSSAIPISIVFVIAFLAGSITTSEPDVLHAAQMLPDGLRAIAVGIWLI